MVVQQHEGKAHHRLSNTADLVPFPTLHFLSLCVINIFYTVPWSLCSNIWSQPLFKLWTTSFLLLLTRLPPGRTLQSFSKLFPSVPSVLVTLEPFCFFFAEKLSTSKGLRQYASYTKCKYKDNANLLRPPIVLYTNQHPASSPPLNSKVNLPILKVHVLSEGTFFYYQTNLGVQEIISLGQ